MSYLKEIYIVFDFWEPLNNVFYEPEIVSLDFSTFFYIV